MLLNKIDKFEGDYSFLSNFYMHPVSYSLIRYPSNEHAYRAAKTLDLEKREIIRNAKTPGEAKKLGRSIELREDWDQIKIAIMTKLVFRKFRNTTLRKKLLDTGESLLIEGNWWGDTFWGECKGKGQNHLGKILMAERDRINETKRKLIC